MYLVVKQRLKKLTIDEYLILRELCHKAKSLKNEMMYLVNEHYENTQTLLFYQDAYKLLKTSANYAMLNSNVAQQIMKRVDRSYYSFFQLLKLKKAGLYDKNVEKPHYLRKNGFSELIIAQVQIKDNKLKVPYSRMFSESHNELKIRIPSILNGRDIKLVQIIPKYEAKFFEVCYTYKVEENPQRVLNKEKVLAIDFGINNLMTCVTNEGKTFIVDGKKLKSWNQWYNKENARLQSLKDLQKIKYFTKKQSYLVYKRNNRINDYLSKAVKLVIRYCLKNNIGRIVLGYNKDFQDNINLGKSNNQKFKQIPFGQLVRKFEYNCKLKGIELILQEESYTSKASFLDRDFIPEYGKEVGKLDFSGKRIKRGMYKSKAGIKINADLNGALNILRKSNVVDIEVLYSRGELDTPLRIKVV